MKLKFLLFILFIPAFTFAQVYKKHSLQKDRLSIQLSEGVLNIVPLSDKAIRVQWEKDGMKEKLEFALAGRRP